MPYALMQQDCDSGGDNRHADDGCLAVLRGHGGDSTLALSLSAETYILRMR